MRKQRKEIAFHTVWYLSKFSIYYARDKTNFRFSYFIRIYVSRGIFFLLILNASSTWSFFFIFFSQVKIAVERRKTKKKFLCEKMSTGEKERRRRVIMDEECNWKFLPGNVSGRVLYRYMLAYAKVFFFMLKTLLKQFMNIFHRLHHLRHFPYLFMLTKGYNYQFFTQLEASNRCK